MHCKCGICGFFLESCIINQQWEFRLRLLGLEIDLQHPLPYPCFPAWHQEWRKHDAGGPREPLKIGDFCITPCFSSQKYQVLKRLAQIVGWKAGSYKTETVQISETQPRKTICAFCLWPRKGGRKTLPRLSPTTRILVLFLLGDGHQAKQFWHRTRLLYRSQKWRLDWVKDVDTWFSWA